MKNKNRYETPRDIELDQYGHIKCDPNVLDSPGFTDPYGDLAFAIGSEDDFVCFDYYIGAIEGRTVFVLHSTLNSETGHFIQDFDYVVIDINNFNAVGAFETAVGEAVANMVDDAIDWRCTNDVKHDRSGWNQDEYYILRAVARRIDRMFSSEPTINGRDNNALRYGGVKINRKCLSALGLNTTLPVSRRPRKKQ